LRAGNLVPVSEDAEASQLREGRVERRRRKNRAALINAGYRVMSEKGIDAATMLEIAELADVGAGTIYNYFESKDELAVAVMEKIMHRLAERIEAVTDTFSDPARVYAFGVRTVMRAAIEDDRWKRLLNRSEVIADAVYRVMGPFAIRDLKNARTAGRYVFEDPELAFRMAVHAIIGFGLAVVSGKVATEKIDEAVVDLLAMVGVERAAAWELARLPCPELPPE
jgi:AcrR family transcriptional regulator